MGDAIEEWAERFTRMMRENIEVRGKLMEWAKDQPHSKMCREHDEVRLVDWDKSTHESRKGNGFVLVYGGCAKCQTDIAIAAESNWLHLKGVPLNLCHCAFSNFTANDVEGRHNLEHAKKFSGKGRGMIFMLGTLGSGKSHLAVSIMRAMGCGKFITNDDLLAKLRASYGPERGEHRGHLQARAPSGPG
jgi:DNA replication protein DnaC